MISAIVLDQWLPTTTLGTTRVVYFQFVLIWCPSYDAPTCKRLPESSSSRNAPRSGSGYANAIRAHVERLSPNDLAVFNAQQIEKAENNGLVYNVETNDVENPENMTRHQRAGMFGHLN